MSSQLSIVTAAFFRFCCQVSGINTYFVSHYSASKLCGGFLGCFFSRTFVFTRVSSAMKHDSRAEDFAQISLIELVPVACLWLAFSSR